MRLIAWGALSIVGASSGVAPGAAGPRPGSVRTAGGGGGALTAPTARTCEGVCSR
jgi:hypothetical protein